MIELIFNPLFRVGCGQLDVDDDYTNQLKLKTCFIASFKSLVLLFTHLFPTHFFLFCHCKQVGL